MYHTVAIRDEWVEMKLGGFRRRDWRRIDRICHPLQLMIVSHDCELLWIEQMQVSMRLRIKLVRYPVWIVALWVIPIQCLNLLAQVHELSLSQVLELTEPLLVSGRTPTAILQPPPGRNIARRAAPQLVQRHLLLVHLLHLEPLPKLDGREGAQAAVAIGVIVACAHEDWLALRVLVQIA